MVNYFIYATDDSGSTSGELYFNTKGLKTVNFFKDEVKALQSSAGHSGKEDRIVYLHWSHRCVKVEENEVIARYKKRNGDGCNTSPHTVQDWMKKNLKKNDTIQLLYMITDGMVSPSDIRPCDPNIKIDKVMFYAFNWNVHNIDMSVASMFICNNKHYVVHCNEDLVVETDLSTPFDYDQVTVTTFYEQIEQLKSYIQLQFLTKSSSDMLALTEIKKLKRLQTRLCDELPGNQKKPADLINLNVKDKESFMKLFKETMFYKRLVNPDYYDESQSIASYINTLIDYINNDNKSFKFDNLKFSQQFAAETEEEEVFNIRYQVEEIAFPDVITCNESEVPVILLTHYNLIKNILFKYGRQMPVGFQRYMRLFGDSPREIRLYHAARLTRMSHFSRFGKTIECPLVLLNDSYFKHSIEHYYNLDAFKSMIEHGIRTGPHTKRPFTGAIVPLEEFDDYNDYILTCTYFDRRRVPFNKGLLYYVIYKTCEKLEYIEPNVVHYLKEYVIKRIAKSKCFLSLSRVTIDNPSMRVDLTTALWYCLELSSTLFKDDPKHFTKEMMRMYCYYTEYMKEILGWFQYDIDTSLVDTRADIYRHVNRLKRTPRRADKIMFILEQIFQKKDGFLIAEIINPDNIYKLNYLLLNHKKVIDESVLSAKIDLDKFVHFMDHVETTDVAVCKGTMRPYFVGEDKKSFYEQLMTHARKVTVQNGKLLLEPADRLDFSRILSTNKLYISYVEHFKKYPDIVQYKKFMLEKKRHFEGKAVVFATNTLAVIENTFALYEKIIKGTVNPIHVTKFMKIAKLTVNRESRLKLEDSIDMDKANISDYIKNSEGNITFNNERKGVMPQRKRKPLGSQKAPDPMKSITQE